MVVRMLVSTESEVFRVWLNLERLLTVHYLGCDIVAIHVVCVRFWCD